MPQNQYNNEQNSNGKYNDKYLEMNNYIGMNSYQAVDKAKVNGLEVRIVKRDGHNILIVMDKKKGSVNFEISNFKVTKAYMY